MPARTTDPFTNGGPLTMTDHPLTDEWGRTGSEDLQTALAEDDAAERAGMHGDRRRTC